MGCGGEVNSQVITAMCWGEDWIDTHMTGTIINIYTQLTTVYRTYCGLRELYHESLFIDYFIHGIDDSAKEVVQYSRSVIVYSRNVRAN